jgi:hypothetical protein
MSPLPPPDRSSTTLFVNGQALPRWFVPERVVSVPRDRVLNFLENLENPRIVAIASEDGPAPPPAPADAIVTLRQQRPGAVRLATSASTDFLLATSLTAVDGWSAQAEGTRLEVRRLNHAFAGVHVPGGDHEIDLRYRPPGFVAGAAVSLAAMAIVLSILAVASGLAGRLKARRPAA